MIDYSDTDARLEEYCEVFDFYMESGELPPSVDTDDCLVNYIKEVIDNNPQVDGSDPTWVEVMKNGLVEYLSSLLEIFGREQKQAQTELNLIGAFENASIERKRQMWQQVKDTIQNNYPPERMNIEGFTDQFKSGNRDAVFAALTDDWRQACEENLQMRLQQTLDITKTGVQQHLNTAGHYDYETIRKDEKYFHSYPKLAEIVDMIGRDKISANDVRDKVVISYLPTTVAKTTAVDEIDRVESGRNLERVLPAEFAMPDDLFFKRYSCGELQQFSSPGKGQLRKVEEPRREPRRVKGPIIVSIDTSYSMKGTPQKIAFSLLRQLIRIARKQKRPCFLITFSVRATAIDLSKPANWSKLNDFIKNGYSGGTDGEQMLAQALRVLKKGTFEMGDVLIVSDFQFPTPQPATSQAIRNEKALGTRFYGLLIGTRPGGYTTVLDKIWKV